MIRPLKLFVPTEMTVIYGPDADDDKVGHKDGDALAPIYRWFPSRVSLAKVPQKQIEFFHFGAQNSVFKVEYCR
jgi:hypothetical protein